MFSMNFKGKCSMKLVSLLKLEPSHNVPQGHHLIVVHLEFQ